MSSFELTIDPIILDHLGLKKEDVLLTLLKHDKHQSAQFQGARIHFYFRALSNNAGYILVHGIERPEDNIEISHAYRIYDDLCPDFTNRLPTELMFELAQRFGLSQTINGFSDKFFFLVPLDLQGSPYGIPAVDENPPRKLKAVEQIPCLHFSYDGVGNVDGMAMLYSLDLKKYLDWVDSHRRA